MQNVLQYMCIYAKVLANLGLMHKII